MSPMFFPRLPTAAALVFPLLAACAAPDPGEYFNASADKQDNATGSRWQIPAVALVEGDQAEITYTGAGRSVSPIK